MCVGGEGRDGRTNTCVRRFLTLLTRSGIKLVSSRYVLYMPQFGIVFCGCVSSSVVKATSHRVLNILH